MKSTNFAKLAALQENQISSPYYYKHGTIHQTISKNSQNSKFKTNDKKFFENKKKISPKYHSQVNKSIHFL